MLWYLPICLSIFLCYLFLTFLKTSVLGSVWKTKIKFVPWKFRWYHEIKNTLSVEYLTQYPSELSFIGNAEFCYICSPLPFVTWMLRYVLWIPTSLASLNGTLLCKFVTSMRQEWLKHRFQKNCLFYVGWNLSLKRYLSMTHPATKLHLGIYLPYKLEGASLLLFSWLTCVRPRFC